MVARTYVSCFAFVLAVAACGDTASSDGGAPSGASSSTTTATSGAGGASTGAGGSAGTTTSTSTGGPGGETFSVKFDPVTLAPGEEDTKCVVRRVGNDGAVHVGQIHNVLSEASHHFIVYKTSDTEEKTTPFACKPFVDLLTPDKGTPLMITQKKDDTLAMPAGVGITFAPGQMVRLEMHYINVTAQPVKAEATATFVTVPDASFKDEADFLFIGSPDIKVPPHATSTLGPMYAPLPADLDGVKFFGMTGHTHQFGTDVKVSTSTSKAGQDTPVYDVPAWSWSEPKTVMFDPPVTVPSGGGFRFTCSWNNTSDAEVGFGESANDEMCFFWTYYYPSRGARVCVHTDQYNPPNGFDLCCPGNPLCAKVL